MNPIGQLPALVVPPSKEELAEDLRIAAATANLPTVQDMQKMVAAVVDRAAREIVSGKLPFRSAQEASKVARDFVAIAKDLNWDTNVEELKKAESDEDRKAAFEEFRKRAQKNLG